MVEARKASGISGVGKRRSRVLGLEGAKSLVQEPYCAQSNGTDVANT